jgi:hypothetical protein
MILTLNEREREVVVDALDTYQLALEDSDDPDDVRTRDDVFTLLARLEPEVSK